MTDPETLLARIERLELENERLDRSNKQLTAECCRLIGLLDGAGKEAYPDDVPSTRVA